MSHDRPTIQLSGPQILAGALAAASAAVVSSWMGVAGTVLGAVVVSLVASIGAALYTPSLERSTQKLRETLPVIPVKPVRSAEERPTAVLTSVDSPTPAPEVGRSSRSQWRTVVVSAAASLVLGFALLTGFEAIVGKSASSLTGTGGGSTTVSSLISHDDSDSTDSTPTDSNPSDPGAPTDGNGAGEPTDQAPSTDEPEPTDDPETTPTEPTPTEPTPTDPSPTEPAPTEPTPTTPTGSASSAPTEGQGTTSSTSIARV